jgi:hypothetical protein
MSRRSKIALIALVGCGGSERHDTTTPTEEVPACPSDAAPGRCRDLADAAATAGHGELAWAYTVLECESHSGAQCAAMWQRHAKSAPTQTDALNVLHAACGHVPAACEQLAAWHTERGHVLAAAAYQKRVDAARQSNHDGAAGPPAQPHAGNTLALAADLAAIMHASDAPTRTDPIAQMVGHELRAPIPHDVAAATPQPQRKAWPMHAAEQGASSDACVGTAKLDHHPVALGACVREVRPLVEDQIALHNRCSEAITVAYTGARADHSTYTNQLRLEPYEARSAGISHRELGALTYAVCSGDCRVTSSPDDASASWTGQVATYSCARGGRP